MHSQLSLTFDIYKEIRVCLLMQRSMDVASASLLEIPPQLAYVFSKLDGKTATYALAYFCFVYMFC